MTSLFPEPVLRSRIDEQNGLDQSVRDYVLGFDEVQGFLTRLYSLVDYLLPLYCIEGKSQLVIAIGCTGGKHRSVVIAEALAQHISGQGYRVMASHRDIGK